MTNLMPQESEFAELTIEPQEVLPTKRIVLDERAYLSIISLSFNKGDNWRFIYQGHKISTKLSDGGLQQAIDEGAAFAKGDALVVELELCQEWNSEYKAYVNQSYRVRRVLEHLHAPRAEELFGEGS